MIINHNLPALNTTRQLSVNGSNSSKSMEKLSSGLRINRAGDDAAGLAISEKMRGQIRGLDQASANAQDSISLIQTAEGALNETQSILQRMRELAVQSASDTATDSDRKQIQKEVGQLKKEVDRISSTTEFNTKKLLNGSLSSAKSVQGTVADSSAVKAADTAATSGASKAGLAATISATSAGHAGTAYTVVGGAALAEKTIIQAGVNDAFDIKINGVDYKDVKLAASPAAGYTRDQFVSALNTALQTTVTANEWANQFNQAVFSLTSDNHLQVATATTGSSATLKVAITTPTTATNGDARAAMGMLEGVNSITGTADVKNGTAVFAGGVLPAAGTNTFSVTLGVNAAVTVDLETDGGLTAGNTYNFEQLKTAFQNGLDAKIGLGAITVGEQTNASGARFLTFTSNMATTAFSMADVGAGAPLATLAGNAAPAATTASPVSNVTTAGTNTVNAVAAGTVISDGANDQFNISVDGSATQTLQLKAGNYATAADLVNEVNNQINANEKLVGKVTASLDADGKIAFTSNATGSTSNVNITAPTSLNRSALGALGYAGAAGSISADATVVSTQLNDGVDLRTAAGDTSMTVTLGNRTVTIDLKGEEGIVDSTTTAATTFATSRDAVVKALQKQLDSAFGKGAISVNTVTTPAGVDTLQLTNNARASQFIIANNAAAAGSTGATILFGAATQSATVSAAGVNTANAGTDAIKNTLSNDTKLSLLADKDGNGLGIAAGNVIKISGTQNGAGFEAAVNVTADSTVADILNSMRNLDAFKGATVRLDTTSGKIVLDGADGATKDISNLAFAAQKSATDTTQVASFNRVFGSFDVTQQAQNGASDSSLVMHIGANQGQVMNVDINEMSTESLRIANVDVSSQGGAETAISVINNALESVSDERAKLGAYQNRLEHTINNLGTSSENLTSSESRIRDVDMAKEMTAFKKNDILNQAAQAMLAQANQQGQGVLQLLR